MRSMVRVRPMDDNGDCWDSANVRSPSLVTSARDHEQ